MAKMHSIGCISDQVRDHRTGFLRPRSEKLTIPNDYYGLESNKSAEVAAGLDARTLRRGKTTHGTNRPGGPLARLAAAMERVEAIGTWLDVGIGVGPDVPLYSGVNGVTFAGR